MAETADNASQRRRGGKSATAFRTISEVADALELPQHVLRFWETKFTAVRPLKRGGGRRYYRPEDVELLRRIRRLLHDDGYTIKGVQKLLRESGGKLTATAPTAPAPREPADTPMAAPGAGPVGGRRVELESIARELEDIRTVLLDAGA